MSRISMYGGVAIALTIGILVIAAPARAQQHTGSVDVVCTNSQNDGDRIAFTIDYDQRTLKGIPYQQFAGILTWDDDRIGWSAQVQGWRYAHSYIFDRRTGTLLVVNPDGPREVDDYYRCRRVTSNDRF